MCVRRAEAASRLPFDHLQCSKKNLHLAVRHKNFLSFFLGARGDTCHVLVPKGAVPFSAVRHCWFPSGQPPSACVHDGASCSTCALGAVAGSASLQLLSRFGASEMVFEIGYVTDIEGNLAYFERWIAQSRILRYTADGIQLEFVHDNAYFVYGGVRSHTQPSGIKRLPRVGHRNLIVAPRSSSQAT